MKGSRFNCTAYSLNMTVIIVVIFTAITVGQERTLEKAFVNTVEPVLGGTVFSGHTLLSGHVVKSRKSRNISTIK